eukprot:gene1979-5235_t
MYTGRRKRLQRDFDEGRMKARTFQELREGGFVQCDEDVVREDTGVTDRLLDTSASRQPLTALPSSSSPHLRACGSFAPLRKLSLLPFRCH